jgi:hypothetical protein
MATRKVDVTITRTFFKEVTVTIDVDSEIVDDDLITYLTENTLLDNLLETEIEKEGLVEGDTECTFLDIENNMGGHL